MHPSRCAPPHQVRQLTERPNNDPALAGKRWG